MAIIELFYQLLVGHALADFVLQQEAMGAGKNRHNEIHARKGYQFPAWYYWLTAHSLIHGGVVYLVTGSLELSAIETVLHWVIDFAKCEEWINFHQDQALHIICKIAYCFFV